MVTILQRPMLLKIFCDWAVMVAEDHDHPDLTSVNAPVKLIRRFVEDYVKKDLKKYHIDELAYHELLAPYSWNLGELAKVALKLHKENGGLGYEFELHLLEDCITGPRNTGPAADALRIMIHKCPFIIKLEEGVGAFSHRTFYEFFVASAVAAEVETETNEQESSNTFDELVLNVDTASSSAT